MLKTLNRNIIIKDNYQCLTHNSKTYFIVHEPTVDVEKPFVPKYPHEIALYGHIHGRSFAKHNGIDLATDYHRFTPINIEQVEWFANAIQYWDKNVFCDVVEVNLH